MFIIMKIIRNIFLAAALVSLCAACSDDLLDKEPLSSGTEAIMFKTPDQFRQAANALYDLEGWKDYNNGNVVSSSFSKVDHNMDTHGLASNGGGSTPESSWAWDKPYGYIRKCNILLQKVTEYEGDHAEIAASVGVAYFFRAWQHFYLLQRFGGIPIADHVLDVDDPVVAGARNSRYEVVHFIASDLREAISRLPKETEIAAADKGKVSREAAKAFLARVLLYEATWEKYTANIGYDLDGEGASVGAGKAKPSGYPTTTQMLTEAKQMAKEVIDEAEAGTFELFNGCDSLSYYYLFSLDDKGGNICNPWGKGKADNKEFIFSVKYDFDLKKGGINLSYTVVTWQAANISAIFGESFLCNNGLPILVSYDGQTVQNNPVFRGFGGIYTEFSNRDYRFIGCCRMPDRPTWASRTQYADPLDQQGKPYPDPVYPQDPYNPDDPAFSDSKNTIYTPFIDRNSTHNAYGCRKFLQEGKGRDGDNNESADYPLIRLAEVHLIYAEAAVELGDGNISDADLNFSINKNRARARVAPLTNALIANVWDANYYDHAQNKTIIKKMNMLDEIRRERACELFAEGFRENDLRRWGVAHINLRGQKVGRRVLNTAFTTTTANDATWHGEPAYNPSTRPLLYGLIEDPTSLDYGRSIATLAGNLLYSQRDYLAPIPQGQIRLNEALKQNPGW
jgi:hypothetical protein